MYILGINAFHGDSSACLIKDGIVLNATEEERFRSKKPFYYCKNDALDRFGTRLEQRFSKSQITELLTKAGCKDVEFSPNTPFWCCIAVKK